MILSQRGSCSPRSLGRRRVEVRVGVIIVVIGIGIGVVLLVLVLILVLLLRVLLLGAPQRTIIKRHPVIRGDVFLGGMVGWQVVLAGRQATWKLDGDV
jgi:hypothetical protein